MKQLEPKLNAKGTGYSIFFHHPILKKTVAKGLNTTDLVAATSICQDVCALFNDAEILQTTNFVKLLGYERRAVEIVFGEEIAEKVFAVSKAFSQEDLAKIEQLHLAGNDPIQQWESLGTWPTPEEQAKQFAEAIKDFDPQAKRRLQEENQNLKKEVKVLRTDQSHTNEELARLHRTHNVLVKARLDQVLGEWKKAYEYGHSDRTYSDSVTSVEAFIEHLPQKGRTRLREVSAAMIDQWIQSLKRKKGVTVLSPGTKRKQKNNLSTFITFAYRRYDLHENPMDKTSPIAGEGRDHQNIKAIRSLKDIEKYLEELEAEPYWRAWAAFAIFAGPRYGEQARIKIENVHSGEGYVIVTATKTGRQRRVPIERSIHRKILNEHLKVRKKQGGFPWLFPTLAPPGPIERSKSLHGTWSHNSNWHDHWDPVAEKLIGKHADFGPDEWRHTFGTMLGNCGWNALEISRAMGNSDKVCQDHYVATTSAGKAGRWPLKW